METKNEHFSLFDENLINELLHHYPKEKHQLLLIQIGAMSDFFEKNSSEYTTNEGFRKAFDLMLSDVLSGVFLDYRGDLFGAGYYRLYPRSTN
jgi:hypothetical protein